jgi:putative photosynthetic complex assembly protein
MPTTFLSGVGLLVCAAIATAALGGSGGDDAASTPVFAAIETRDLRFEDRADGGVLVFDAADGAQIATLEPGEGGFTRSILRGLVRERRINHVGGRSAFRLQRLANGGLMLGDPATGREIHLAAFGTSNVAAFERLMTAEASME